MSLNLSDVANHPTLLTCKITLPSGENVTFRPLQKKDVGSLTQFLKKLSLETRGNYVLKSYDKAMAQELCDAIARYDKLRFVVVNNLTRQTIALFEYSFDIPDNDRERYLKYNIKLNSQSDLRIGPCLADKYQRRGIGTMIFPCLIDIARKFGRKRMILWGGVFLKNVWAVKFYEKIGFKKLGVFKDESGRESVDMIIKI